MALREKECIACRVMKPITEFYARPSTASGYHGKCKRCLLDYQAEQYRTSMTLKARRRDRHYRNTYGVTSAEVEEMRAAQDGRCALCGRPEEESHNGLHLDHDHITTTVRGLLCADCNTSLGKLQDDPDLLRRAADYIEAHRALPEFNP